MHGIAAFRETHIPQIVNLTQPPVPQHGQVLCRTLELGVCGTDREILSSQQPATPPNDNFLVLGHECIAQVEAVGPDVKNFSPGNLVVPLVRRAITPSPYRCDLLSSEHFVERGIFRAHGFSAQQWIDNQEYLLPIHSKIKSLAVLAEPTSIAEKGINESILVQEARLGNNVWITHPPRVLVTGMGPIGFLAVIACRCRNWSVTHFGRDPQDSFRACLSKDFETTYTDHLDEPASLDDLVEKPFDLILECTGSDEVMLRAAQTLAPRGVMVWLGSSRQPRAQKRNAALLMRQGLARNNIFIGSVNSAPRDFHDALIHLTQMQEQFPQAMAKLITDRVTPDDSLWHYEHRRPQGIKTIVVYQ